MTTAKTESMKGKTCVITGATAGIGKVTALALAAQGARVIIVGRNPEKLKATLGELQVGNEPHASVQCDFEDLGQVRAAAKELHRQCPQVDVLVNNAGAFFNFRHEVAGGVEQTLLVNHLAPFLLTNLVLDLLRARPAARIINLSSDAHRMDKMDFDDLSFRRGYVGIRAYARSKLAAVLFTRELARRLEGSRVTVNAVHPGHVATDIWRTNFSVFGPALKWFMGLFALTPEQGADTVIWLASSPEVEGVTGKYFAKRQAVEPSRVACDAAVALRLWELSEKLTAL